ncbi:hypothetical protein B5G43_14585 [Flavonifractor sp. An92]|uniref:hypothetical protein n=1 Tax=Flavonifractor sp. An92 TaxID=1965666 RepID=UPI000B37DB13|nr:MULTISPECIES: hypothetical protein [unclassified Flavonifractor]OUN04205.1 hypothetical protein B5G43_14585 [Flavonifractor sp. An92]OUQ21632.1 hypothetical protein B5E80_16245 [Flavonifractor sp. An135]
MVITKTFSKREDILKLRDLALSVPEAVTVRSLNGSVSMNAKSPMGIYALDFTQPVEIVTDSDKLVQEIERW